MMKLQKIGNTRSQDKRSINGMTSIENGISDEFKTVIGNVLTESVLHNRDYNPLKRKRSMVENSVEVCKEDNYEKFEKKQKLCEDNSSKNLKCTSQNSKDLNDLSESDFEFVSYYFEPEVSIVFSHSWIANSYSKRNPKYECKVLEFLTMGLNLNNHEYELFCQETSEKSHDFTNIVINLQSNEISPGCIIYSEIEYTKGMVRKELENFFSKRFLSYFLSFCLIRQQYVQTGNRDKVKEFDETAIFYLITDQNNSEHYEKLKLKPISEDHILFQLGFTNGCHLKLDSVPEILNSHQFKQCLEHMSKNQKLSEKDLLEMFKKKLVMSFEFDEMYLKNETSEMLKLKYGQRYNSILNRLYHMEMMDFIIGSSEKLDDVSQNIILERLQNELEFFKAEISIKQFSKIALFQTELNESRDRLKQAHTEILNAFNIIQRQNLEIIDLKNQYKDDIEKQIEVKKALNNHHEQFDDEKFELHNKIEALMIEKLKKQDKDREIAKRLRDSENERASLLHLVDMSNNLIANYENLIANYRTNLGSSKTEIKILKEQNILLNKTLERLKIDIEKLKKQLNYFTEENINLQVSFHEMISLYEEHESQLQFFEKEYEKVQKLDELLLSYLDLDQKDQFAKEEKDSLDNREFNFLEKTNKKIKKTRRYSHFFF